MPVPTGVEWSTATFVAAHTAFRDLIDGGATAGSIKVRDAADVLLAQIPLNDPCGSINGGTGQLTFDVTNAKDTSADMTGTAAYAQFCDSNGNVHLAMPAQAGTAPVSGKFVLNTLSIVSGGPVELVSATVG